MNEYYSWLLNRSIDKNGGKVHPVFLVYGAWGQTIPNDRIPILGMESSAFFGEVFVSKLMYLSTRKGVDVTQLSVEQLDKLYEMAHYEKLGEMAMNWDLALAIIAPVMGVKGMGNTVGNSTEITNLLDNMPELTGSNRDKLLSVIQNSKLRNIVDQLYRPGATVGDGGTASILKQEFSQGSSTHLIKAQERLTQLNNLAKSEKLGLNDLDILDALRNDLNDAINLFK